jgi:hypothetical protein
MFAISKDKGMDRNGLIELLKAEYNVGRLEVTESLALLTAAFPGAL